MTLWDDTNETIELRGGFAPTSAAAHDLTVVSGHASGKLVLAGAEPATLGRDTSRPFHLLDDGVSHARRASL
jgi:hypothetical protein